MAKVGRILLAKLDIFDILKKIGVIPKFRLVGGSACPGFTSGTPPLIDVSDLETSGKGPLRKFGMTPVYDGCSEAVLFNRDIN